MATPIILKPAPVPHQSDCRLDEPARNELLGLARRSVVDGLARGACVDLDTGTLAPRLRETRACFVTLEVDGALRGCCGSLEARRALGLDAWHNAYASAFLDHRLAAIVPGEVARMAVEISVLSHIEPLEAPDEAALLSRLRPGIDGVVVSSGNRRATFLPKVWRSFDGPAAFVQRLREKAGIPATTPASELTWQRYTAESFGTGPVN